MTLESALPSDIDNIMSIIHDAQKFLADSNVDQWQNNYPSKQIILNDINNKESYVLKSKQSELIATAMFTTKGEPTYDKIIGQWLTPSDSKYGVIHRMAIGETYRSKGFSKFLFSQFEKILLDQKIQAMRIDTHQDNTTMQKLLHALDYKYCGIIFLQNGDKRLAFEKILF